MEIAVILSAGLRDWIDFGVIVSLHQTKDSSTFWVGHKIGILFLNAGVGWYQEKYVFDMRLPLLHADY